MDSEKIRMVLSGIDVDSCGFEAYAVINPDKVLKRLLFSEQGEHGGLNYEIKRFLVDTIRDKFLRSDARYLPSSQIADETQAFYIIEQTDTYQPFSFFDSVSDLFLETDINEINGFVFVYRYGDNEVYLYQRGNNTTVPNRKRMHVLTKLLAGDDSLILEQQREPLLTISKGIDAIIINKYIITDNLKMMERNFDFQDYINERAQKATNEIVNTGFFSNTNKLNEYLSRGEQSKHYARKMMRVSGSPVFDMTSDELFQKITTVDRWKGVFKTPVDGRIPLESYRDVENVIDLFDERYTISEITGQEYDTDVKRVASKIVRE